MTEEVSGRSVYRLRPVDSATVTRHDFIQWSHTLQSYCRRRKFTKFLTGGQKQQWTTAADHGMIVARTGDMSQQDAKDASDALLGEFLDFLTVVATHCPVGTFETVFKESTSWEWIMTLVKRVHRLDNRGRHFLDGEAIKIELSPTFTPEQAWMEVKDFYSAGLLKSGDNFKGRPLAADEVMSPTLEMFLVREWLNKIDPRLTSHIHKTRGALFTTAAPSIVCNRETIADLIPTLLKELEDKEDFTTNQVDVVPIDCSIQNVNSSQATARYSQRGYGPRQIFKLLKIASCVSKKGI